MNSEDNDTRYDEGEESSLVYIVQLPEVVLVTILQHLMLKERYYMSQTCRLFHQLFSHPRLWQVADINLVSQISTKSEEEIKYCTWNKMPVPDQVLEDIVKRYKSVFRHVELEMSGVYCPFKDVCYSVLLDLNKASQIESLTLRIPTFTRPQFTKPSTLKDFYLLNGLIRNAVCLKHLSIISWPFALEAGVEDKIIYTLFTNSNILYLQTLQLFFIEAKDGPWAKIIPHILSPEFTFEIISHFQHLNCLALRSSMLSNDLFKELSCSSRSPLRSFKVLIAYSSAPQPSNNTDISPSAWFTFIKACPKLRVEYVITTRTPLNHLQHLFNPHVPLVSVTVLDYGKCDRAFLELLTSLYFASLESLAIFCDCWHCDKVLISLVESCPRLKSLIFCGDLYKRTVVSLAELINRLERKFTTFKFKGENIQTEPIIEEDAVITRNSETNEYVIVPIKMWNYDKVHVMQRLIELDQTVFTLTGCHCLLEDKLKL